MTLAEALTHHSEPVSSSAVPALRLRNVSKAFPGVHALRGIDLEVAHASVHALLGHNGCGKSTLVKTLAGIHAPDPGAEAWVDGVPLELGSAEAAAREGIHFVHQELGIILELGAVDNVGFVLGYERSRHGAISWRKQARRTTELLDRFGIKIDPRLPLSEASPVERTAVAIVRAVAGWEPGRGLLILDEPTAALPAREVNELFRLIRDIRDSGTAVLLISHRLDEVMAVADRATVMREGLVIWEGSIAGMTIGAFADLIAGKDAGIDVERVPRVRRTAQEGAPALQATKVVGRYLRGVDLTVNDGEIVGIAGLLGSGREELPYIVAGIHRDGVSGSFSIRGQQLEELSITYARACGVAFVPADRAREAIIGDFKVRENVSISALPSLRRGPVLPPSGERRFVRKWLTSVSANVAVIERPVTTLSGGNQQKVVLARWLSTEPKLLVLSEPTAGVDVGARETLYEELRRRADDGLGILLCSSDIEDLLAVCDRVVVLRDGVVVAEYHEAEIDKAAIVSAMEGVHSEES